MFCDLVGSTDLSGELDPEDLRAIVMAYQQAAAEAIEANGGYIAHYMGDGILAYFGYPFADERAAEHAVRAGLDLLDRVDDRRVDFPAMAVRVGIHAGITVVADMGAGATRQERDVIGETPNVAARIQSIANVGAVVVSNEVATACAAIVEFESIGEHQLKGVRRPLELFRALAVSGTGDRLDVTTARHGLTPLVGRDADLDTIRTAWRRTQAGDPQVVWVVGEPGIGKSRLVRELINDVRADGGIEIEFRCSALHQSSSLYPSAEQFRRYMVKRTGEVSLAAAELLADEDGTPRSVAVPVIADLLGIPLSERYQPIRGSADRVREETLEVVGRLVTDRAAHQSVLVVIDDMQWMDQTSLELAQQFITTQRTDRVMTIVTHRSDPPPTIPALAHHVTLTLQRLDESNIRAIVNHVAGRHLEAGHDVDLDMLEAISKRTEGIPLFAEELAYLADQPGSGKGAPLPATLRDSLMARVDRLGPEVDIIRTLAVLGREASTNLLLEVSGIDQAAFDHRTDALIDRGMLIRRGDGAQAVYSFRHGLLEEVVYESLLHSTRRSLHERSAAVLESRFADRSTIQPEVSARHLELSGQIDRAIPFLLSAGDRAIAISAHDEALVHLEHAFALTAQLPEGTERDLLELDTQIRLGVPLTARHGYASPAALAAYSRAQQLCEMVGGAAPVYPALYGLFRTRLLRGEYDTAESLAERLAEIASTADQPTAWVIGADRALGSVAFYRGADQQQALSVLERVLAAPDADRPGAYLGDLNDVVDPVITCRSYAAWSSWLLGEPKRSRELSDRAIADARRLSHPFTLGLALSFDTWSTQFEGDVDATIERATEALHHAQTHGFVFWVGWAKVLLAWASSKGGDPAAPDAMRAGIDEWQSLGSRLGATYFHGLVADGEIQLGEFDAAASTLTRAMELADELGEGFWIPELLRMQADVERRLGHGDGNDLLRRAGALANEQGSVGLVRRIETMRATR